MCYGFASNKKPKHFKMQKKSKINLDAKRKIFFSSGLLIALGLSLVAFEWRTGQIIGQEMVLYDTSYDQLIHEETPQEVKRKNIPPKIKNEPKNDITVVDTLKTAILFVEDTSLINLIVYNPLLPIDTTGSDEGPFIDIDTTIKCIVEKSCTYPGGQAVLLSWLNGHIKYPEKAIEVRAEGRVFVQFVVEKDGTISDVKTIGKVPHVSLGEEAVKKVRKIPGRWTPGETNGRAVRSYFKLPVMFSL